MPVEILSNAAQSAAGGSNNSAALSSAVKDVMMGPVSYITECATELVAEWHVLLFVLCGTILLSFVWLLILRLIALPMTILILISMLLVLLTLCLLCFVQAGLIDAPEIVDARMAKFSIDKERYTNWQRDAEIAGWVLAVLTIVYFLVMCFMIKRILMAVGIIQTAAKAMGCMPSLLLLPLLSICSAMGLIIFWGFGIVYIAAMGSYNTETLSWEFRQNSTTCDTTNLSWISCDAQYHLIVAYHVFGFLWTYGVLMGIGYIIIAGCFAEWYFRQHELREKTVYITPLSSCTWRVLRYHLGSVCFGAAILAIAQMVRLIFNAVMSKLTKHKDNAAMKFILVCVNCCLKCLEKLIETINHNAYIMIAIEGQSFCTAAGEAFALLLKNVLRLSAVTIIGDIILFIGKLVVTGLSVGALWLFFIYHENKDPPTYVLLVCALESFVVTSAFHYVFDVGIDTILLCVLIDLEKNDGSDRAPYCMSDFLRSMLVDRSRSQNKAMSSVAPAL